jgi:hypothetical protein
LPTQTLAIASILRYRQVCLCIAAFLLLVPLFNSTAALVRELPAPLRTHPAAETSPVAPTVQTLPPAVMPALRAALAADDAEEYRAVAAAPAVLRAANPAHRFSTTFDTEGVHIAPISGPAWTLRTAAVTGDGSILLTATPPTINKERVEYWRDGLTEWYVNSRSTSPWWVKPSYPPGTARS